MVQSREDRVIEGATVGVLGGAIAGYLGGGPLNLGGLAGKMALGAVGGVLAGLASVVIFLVF